jgi:hypothetical protein
VKELWEQNLSQKDMISTLVEEGYDVGEREVARIRSKNGWLLRSANDGYGQPVSARRSARRRTGSVEEVDDDGEGDVETGGNDAEVAHGDAHGDHAHGIHDDQSYWNYGASGLEAVDAQVQDETLNAMREARREYRKRTYEVEVQERWMTKKRRRHTRPYGGLPADPPGPPRFPSETTLTEAKEILQLDKNEYKTFREKFYTLCVDAGVWKKTLVGPERWEALKDQLVRESMHLRAVMWDPADMDRKRLAIEVICCDVTKRIRTEATAMHMTDAKLVLGLNPEEGRVIRGQLYNLLAQEKFTSKLEEGLDYFEELKQRWIAGSPVLGSVVAVGPSDPDYQRKMKAINVLCRDATRRYRDDVFRQGKTPAILKPPTEKTPTPEPKAKTPRKPSAKAAAKKAAQSTSAPAQTPAAASEPTATGSPAPAPAPPPQPRRRGRPPGTRNKKKALPHTESRLVPADLVEPQADQQILDAQLGAADVPVAPEHQNRFADEQYVQGYAAAQQSQTYQQQHPPPPQPQLQQQQAAPVPAPASPGAPGAIAAFFRLSSASMMMFPGVQTQWICPLNSRTMDELRSAALQKTPGGLCYKIEGMVKDGKGGELPLPVSDAAELETYLQHVQGHAPTLRVSVVPGEDQTWA